MAVRVHSKHCLWVLDSCVSAVTVSTNVFYQVATYVTVVQTVVLYCNISEYFSAVYYALCNSFNRMDIDGSEKSGVHGENEMQCIELEDLI
jgi:hypothetical protein